MNFTKWTFRSISMKMRIESFERVEAECESLDPGYPFFDG